MSDEENTNQAAEPAEIANPTTEPAATQSSSGLTATLLNLKDSNPKVFFGAIGAVAVLFLVIVMSGGESNPIPASAPKNLVIGQKYKLKNPNAYEVASPIRLVTVPGAIAAYDDSEDETKKEACRQIPQGTAVTLTELQDAYGKKNVFGKVKIDEGDCLGSEGWVLSIDVQ